MRCRWLPGIIWNCQLLPSGLLITQMEVAEAWKGHLTLPKGSLGRTWCLLIWGFNIFPRESILVGCLLTQIGQNQVKHPGWDDIGKWYEDLKSQKFQFVVCVFLVGWISWQEWLVWLLVLDPLWTLRFPWPHFRDCQGNVETLPWTSLLRMAPWRDGWSGRRFRCRVCTALFIVCSVM